MLHSTCPHPPIARGLPATREGISGSTPSTVHNSPLCTRGGGDPSTSHQDSAAPRPPAAGHLAFRSLTLSMQDVRGGAVGAAAPLFSPVPPSWVPEKWGLLEPDWWKGLAISE